MPKIWKHSKKKKPHGAEGRADSEDGEPEEEEVLIKLNYGPPPNPEDVMEDDLVGLHSLTQLMALVQ